MTDVSPQDAHADYMAKRKDRLAELILPKVAQLDAEREEREELAQAVSALTHGQRRNYGVTDFPEGEAAGFSEEETVETLPDGWQDLPWRDRKTLAEDLSGREMENTAAADDYLSSLEG
ncbi:MAG: hypothetical protein JKY34_09255 [Kordiimonadaceae bacterium]|nr:hypothetical protein [Kordiimonadaceae bacterium]